MIPIHNLKKYYKNRLVLDIEYLHFKIGKAYLLCGANGSGKSTLVKSILKIIDYEGEIVKNTSKIGYLPERFPEVSYISGINFLQGLKCDNNISKIEELAKYFSLDLKLSISNLSKGNLQKVMIIQAIMNDASLLIFDEPLNGLDPASQDKFINLLKTFKESSRCIIITTHYPKYYEGLFDEVIYLEKGKIYENK